MSSIFFRSTLVEQIEFVVVKIDGAVNEIAFKAFGVVAGGGGGHVFLSGRKDFLRGCHRRAARPDAHFARIARIGEAARAEVGGNEDVVAVYPAERAFGFGAVEAVFDKFFAVQIKFAGNVGIRPAAREAARQRL